MGPFTKDIRRKGGLKIESRGGRKEGGHVTTLKYFEQILHVN